MAQIGHFYLVVTNKYIYIHSCRPQRLQFQVSLLSRHSQNAECVGVAKPAFPPLHCDDGSTVPDDIQRKCIAKSKPDSIVNLYQFSRLRTSSYY